MCTYILYTWSLYIYPTDLSPDGWTGIPPSLTIVRVGRLCPVLSVGLLPSPTLVSWLGWVPCVGSVGCRGVRSLLLPVSSLCPVGLREVVRRVSSAYLKPVVSCVVRPLPKGWLDATPQVRRTCFSPGARRSTVGEFGWVSVDLWLKTLLLFGVHAPEW